MNSLVAPWPRHILVPGIAIAGGTGCGPPPPGLAGELRVARNFAPNRQQEFLWGRHYARAALAEFGIAGFDLLRAADRSPCWPAGMTGSISHCPALCLAIAARKRDILALGLDVESAAPLPARLHLSICSKAELDDAIAVLGEPGIAAKVLFSIKESIYKAYAPFVGKFLGFQDVVVALDPIRGSFISKIVNPILPDPFGKHEPTGRFAVCGGFTYAVCALSRTAAAEPGLISIASTSSSLSVSTKRTS